MSIDLTKETPWSITRAAQFMGVSTRTVERYFDKGLEFVWLGPKRRTTRAAIDRYKVPGNAVQSAADNAEHRRAEQELARLGVL